MSKGKLTIFLGSAPGVGKTYAMLETAQERLAERTDIVIGWLEPHQRMETQILAKGLSTVVAKIFEYRGIKISEMDIDAILSRRPDIVIVDELAHTNAENSRHIKRFQDVEELLSAGINVYTTLNVQHIESLNDIVTQITGLVVNETVPDRILEMAAQIQLVDISTDELMQRFKEGKVFDTVKVKEALNNFFQPIKINALRELALRYTAQKVDRQLESEMRINQVVGPWTAGERILVCISPSPFSAQLIRIARRMAEGLQAQWLAVNVETHRRFPFKESEKDNLAKNIRLAEELGAETISITGNDVAAEIINLAQKRNVSQIIIGKPLHSRIRELLYGSVVDSLIRQSHGISVHVIPGGKNPEKPVEINEKNIEEKKKFSYLSFLKALFIMAVTTGITYPFISYLGLVNVAMIYLLPVLFSASRWGQGTAIFSAVVGVICFDIFFVPPQFSFSVSDFRYTISFIIFILVGLITGTLSTRSKLQAVHARQREERLAALYSLSRDISAVSDLDSVANNIVNKISDAIDGQVVLLLPNENGKLDIIANSCKDSPINDNDRGVANWAFERKQKAGKGTDTLRNAKGLYIPVMTEDEIHAVLGIGINSNCKFEPEQLRLIDAFAGLAANALNRIKLTEQARQAQNLVESERLRTALFNSISHDMRTPLSSIIGAVTSLIEGEKIFNSDARQELLSSILQGATRMTRFINNLLEMARLESGMLRLNKEWCDVQDIIGVAISQMGDNLKNRPLKVEIKSELPLVKGDFVLIEQVIINLLDNALKYSVPESEISITAAKADNEIEVAVSDYGQIIPENDLGKIFDKFYRLSSPLQVSGSGLGLSICKGIIEAHEGKIWAENSSYGGVKITFTLPISEELPREVPYD